MAPSCRWVVALATVAVTAGAPLSRPTHEEYKEIKAQEKADREAQAAKDKKMAAVNKVIELLKDLKASVLSEGEKEAATYNKFACFCKDMTAEKEEAIEKGEDRRDMLSTSINELSDDRDEYDEKIEELEEDIEEAEEFMAKKTKVRKEENKVYLEDEADLSGAIAAVEGALQAIKASKSFVQVQSAVKSVQKAIMLADALGLKSASSKLTSFLQTDKPSVEMEDYKFKSDSVLELLEGLLHDLRDQKNELDQEEVDTVNEYDHYMLDKNFDVKTMKEEMERTKKKKEVATKEIAMNSDMLTTTASEILDDQQYLMELSHMCSDKAKTWDQRTRVRADELSALTTAIQIVEGEVADKTTAAAVRFSQQGVSVRLAYSLANNPDRMNDLEAAAEQADAKSGTPSFLQMQKPRSLLGFLQRHHLVASKPQDVSEKSRQAVLEVLNGAAKKFHSTLLTSMATQIATKNDAMYKVQVLIEEVIEKLKQEAADEAEQKGFCDKSLYEAEEKRDQAAEKSRELNTEMSELETRRNELNEELANLEAEIAEIVQKQNEAEKNRAAEKAENEDTVDVAKEGLEALKEAIKTLKDFYDGAKDEEVDSKLLQKQKGPKDDAPETFDDEAYKGNEKSGGVLAMLDVIKSDFERTIDETEQAEKEGEQDHTAFMDESTKAKEGLEDAETEKKSSLDDTEEALESATADLESETGILKGAIEELLELKATCIDTGMTYEERVEAREEEIHALKKALCVLVNFEKLGPEKAAEIC